MANLLKPCPKSDCKAPITHWHGAFGHFEVCTFALRGEPCLHVEASNHRCYAPRVQPGRPLILSDVDTVAEAIYESDYALPEWHNEGEIIKDQYRRNAQAALEIIAAHQPVWHRVEPGAKVKARQRWRVENADGDANEGVSIGSWDVPDDDSITVYVLRTPDAPETKESIVREFAAEIDRIYTARTAGDGTWLGVLGNLVSRLDALGGESA